MILGTGIDMIEVERVAEKMARAEGFRELVFSKNEIDYCEQKKNKFEHYAARFAAKEAFYKAIGAGWMNGTSFNEIEISNDEKGKPSLTLIGETSQLKEQMKIKTIHVSLTHLKTMASAIVIIETE
ncbi:MAG: holo-ACP synthase [Ferruginibacter sp.]